MGWLRSGAVAASASLVLLTFGTPGSVATASSPNPGEQDVLRAVSAVSATNAWAVGSYWDTTTNAFKTLIVHWNGTAWRQVASPTPDNGFLQLNGVSADSATDAWAVGYYDVPGGQITSLILHWNGSGWTQMASPVRAGPLWGVSALSATDAWAVGHRVTPKGVKTLVLHWDGTSWSRVNSPNPSRTDDPSLTYNHLNGVSAVSGTDAWAVGIFETTDAFKSLVMRWNGKTWSRVKSRNPSLTSNQLYGVSADSSTDAWAVGLYFSNMSRSDERTLTIRWNGLSWSRVPSPPWAHQYNTLSGVSARRPTDVWAVGSYCCTGGNGYTLVLHWDGSAWSRVSTPPGPGSGPELLAVDAVSATDAWAVGDYSSPTLGTATLIMHWDGTTWTVT
jgi:hypothetical protein